MTVNRINIVIGIVLVFLVFGCVTTKITPTSYSREEILRRDAVSLVEKGMSADSVAQIMRENGFTCVKVKGGQFDYSTNVSTRVEPGKVFDFVLCERADSNPGTVSQVAVLLNADVATGNVLVKRISANEDD